MTGYSILSLLRPKHWIKNLLIALPLIFSGRLLETDLLVTTGLGFVAFCLASSVVYIINDLADADNDRLHPEKKNRPIASGAVSTRVAIALCIICFVTSIGLDCLADSAHSPINVHMPFILFYIGMNVAYSRFLKNYPIVDVACLSLGFLLRVLYGGSLCGIDISSWLFLTILSLAFFFSLGKRRNELRTIGAMARASLDTESYTVAFLDKCMYVFLACGITFYALWATTGVQATISSQGKTFLLVTVFIAMVTCMRYCIDIEAEDAGGDPVTTVMNDKILLIAIATWCIFAFLALYL